jgi:hypothetical protein
MLIIISSFLLDSVCCFSLSQILSTSLHLLFFLSNNFPFFSPQRKTYVISIIRRKKKNSSVHWERSRRTVYVVRTMERCGRVFLIILKFFVLDGEECGKYKEWIQSKYDATIEYFFFDRNFFCYIQIFRFDLF